MLLAFIHWIVIYPVDSVIQPLKLFEQLGPGRRRRRGLLKLHGFVVLPCVQGVSEKIGRILKQQKVKVAYKPQQTSTAFFRVPKSEKILTARNQA